MPPPTRNHRAPLRPTPRELLPRRALIDPENKAYNRVIRLEGQISTIIQIHRFLWRYKVCNREYTISAEPALDPTILNEYYPKNASHHDRVNFIKNAATLEELKSKREQKMTDDFLDAGRMVYFDMIDELVEMFLNDGVDLAYEGYNLGGFVALIKDDYLRFLPKKEREKEGLWAKIWWLRHLQIIL
jgi:hypothetical protein